MQSGVLSADNLPDVLRGISQRRRQGVLEIQGSEGITTIRFVQGRVVEAFSSRLTPVQECIEWLQWAGYPVKDPKDYTEVNYQELAIRLQAELKADLSVSTTLLAHVVKHRVLERLYKLDVGTGSLYSFKVQMVEQEKGFSPNISVGQLLLDLVELNAERDHFYSRFPDTAIVRALCTPADITDEDEGVIIRSIGAGCSLAELERKCLLSSYHFKHALLSLHTAGKIEVVASNQMQADTHSAVDSFVTSSVDAAFSDAHDAGQRGSSEGTLESLVGEDGTGSSESPARGLALQMLSARMLQSSAVPRALGVLFIVVGLLGPFILWSGIIFAFSE
jgi:hypothetical protein